VSSPARGARAVYDAIADAYDAALHDELEHKPLDRALLAAVAEYPSRRSYLLGTRR
jgi:hypothetical protein